MLGEVSLERLRVARREFTVEQLAHKELRLVSADLCWWLHRFRRRTMPVNVTEGKTVI